MKYQHAVSISLISSHSSTSWSPPETAEAEEWIMRESLRDGDTAQASDSGEEVIKRGAEWRGGERRCAADFWIWRVIMTGLDGQGKTAEHLKGYSLYQCVYCMLCYRPLSSQMSLSRTLTHRKPLLRFVNTYKDFCSYTLHNATHNFYASTSGIYV